MDMRTKPGRHGVSLLQSPPPPYYARRAIRAYTRPPMKSALRPTRFLLPVLAAFAFTGCSQYAKVSYKDPVFRLGNLATASAEQRQIQDALKKEKRDPLAALGEFLAAAEAASRRLAANPGDSAAMEDYNFAVARVHGTLKRSQLDPWSRPLVVPAAGGDFQLTHKPDKRGKNWNPGALRIHPGGPVRHRRHVRRPSTTARPGSARRSSPSAAISTRMPPRITRCRASTTASPPSSASRDAAP